MANEVPIVQFAAQIMYSDEGLSKEIEVMRIGGLDKTCSVSYDALDKKLEGEKFHKCSGTLEFGPNETSKSFTLRLIGEKSFDSVVELPFRLTAVKNCEVGSYLYKTRVKIIDDDVFPSAKFEAEIKSDPKCDSWKEGSDFAMLWEIAKLCYSINPSGSRWIIMGDQINNLIFIAQLELGKRLITALSDKTHSWHTRHHIIILAILMTAPYLYTHIFSYRKQFWKVGGMVRKEMMKDLMVRSLYYEEATRDQIHCTELQETFGHHVFTIVGDGYMKFFEVSAATGRLVMLLVYFVIAVTMSVMEGKGPHQFSFLFLFLVIPTAAIVFMRIRAQASSRVREQTEDAKVDLVKYMGVVSDNYRVVADCWARPLVVEEAIQKINAVNKLLVHQGARQANDMAFFGWTSELVDCAFIILGGILIIEGIITSLGVFTATLAGLRGASAQYARIYQAVLSMQSTYPSVWLLVEYMNLPMDLDQRLTLATSNRKQWSEGLGMAQKDERVRRGELNAEDVMPILLKDVRFEYKVNLMQKLTSNIRTSHRGGSSRVSTLINQDVPQKGVLESVNLEIPQGKLVCITGLPGHGKGTLLRVLADVLMPTSGSVFVPSHLRVLHVQIQEKLYEGSIAFNVYFALLASRGLLKVGDLDEEELARGVRVCKALGMMPHVIDAVENFQNKQGTHSEGLSLTTKVRIQLARALIANPEVLVLHMPCDSLRATQAEVVITKLREFVDNKGVELPEDVSGRRRPRTCIFTSNHHHILEKADTIWSVVDGQMEEKMLLGTAGTQDGRDVLEFSI